MPILDLGAGYTMNYEEHGSPKGKPVVVLHGGPGGGIQRYQLSQFNLKRWRVIMFDQRGCGLSEPRGLDSLKHNTTWDLVSDIEKLREYLGVDAWVVFGGSWGSTLALAYAEKHPSQVTALILRGVCLMQKWELDWLYNGGVQAVWPDAFSAFTNGSARKTNYVKLYKKQLNNRKTRKVAAKRWWGFESALSFLKPKRDTTSPKATEELAILENHYFSHNAWLKPDQLLRGASKLTMPITIVQGRYDMVCPFRAAWELKQRVPHAKLVVIEDAGHSGSEPGIAKALRAATDSLI
jgi:proline iminopeptidase